MNKNRCSPVTLVLSLAIGAFLICAATAQAVAAAGPAASHLTASVRSVQPAVSGLFQVHTPRAWTDALDESGQPGANGVPDFLDSWQAFRAREASAILKNGYAFKTIDEMGDLILYAGALRASSAGPSKVAFEFSQKPGERLLGDLQINAEIDGVGNLGTVRFQSYSEGKGSGKFIQLALLSGEGCSDAGTACVVANGALLEVGVNLSQLLSGSGGFKGVKITTPEDSAAGAIRPMFSSSNADCVVEQGGFKKANCTANDVRLTAIVEGSLEISSGAGCNSNKKCFNNTTGLDTGVSCTGTNGTQGSCTAGNTCYATITFTATGQYIVGPQRYDIGLYIATDTDPNSNGAKSGNCDRFDFPIGTAETTDLDDDDCADVAPGSTPEVDFGPVTIPCIDVKSPGATLDDPPLNTSDGQADVNHCETWANSADGVCGGSADVKAETSSKCFCGLLAGACIAIDDLNNCTTEVCRGNCRPASGTGGSGTICFDNLGCTAPETCRGITLHHDPVTNGTSCGAGGDECNNPFACQNGTCVAGGPKGDGIACGDPSDTTCDNPDTCLAGVCEPNHEPGGDTVPCTTSQGSCDPLEYCDGNGNCPTDFCVGGVVKPS
ncbi:MAG TPA: hypothetical protein VGS98_01115 [Thermoanaerobaculia bacterium]|nr:hypothetical protein [Thermoanaerobaculia bacterium]